MFRMSIPIRGCIQRYIGTKQFSQLPKSIFPARSSLTSRSYRTEPWSTQYPPSASGRATAGSGGLGVLSLWFWYLYFFVLPEEIVLDTSEVGLSSKNEKETIRLNREAQIVVMGLLAAKVLIHGKPRVQTPAQRDVD